MINSHLPASPAPRVVDKIQVSLALLFLCLSPLSGEDSRPNFLFILADDQSYETIRAHGHEEIMTPNLDRLVESGTSFTNAYNMGGWHGAICVASRSMLNTGRTLWRAKTQEDQLDQLAERNELWPQLLQMVGYETYFTGKWHIKIDPETIFDHVSHERPGMPPDLWGQMMSGAVDPDMAFMKTIPGYVRPVIGEPDPWSPYDRSQGGFWEGGKHWSEVLADDAEEFLKAATASDQPFFMYLAFNAPHDPRQSPKRFVDMYPLEEIEVPASYLPEYPYKDEIGCVPRIRDEALAPFPRTEFAVRTHRQEYYALISHMDEQIGRILEALEKTGKADNTYIIFTADHGLACGNHGFMGKQNMYDHSMKVPFIVVGPAVPKDKRNPELVYLQDVVPTTLHLAGTRIPEFVEFNNLWSLITDAEAESPYETIYGAYQTDEQRMIREGDYKLIVYPKADRVRLFNLRQDPLETRDLSGSPGHWEEIHELFSKLQDVQRAMDDQLDLSTVFPEFSSSSMVAHPSSQ